MVKMDNPNTCSICYEDLAQDLEAGTSDSMKSPGPCGKEFLRIQRCYHIFCRDCLLEYCKHAISYRAVPISCPATACPEIIQEEHVKDIFCAKKALAKDITLGDDERASSAETTDPRSPERHWEQYQRWLRLIQDPSLIACARCDQLFPRLGEANSKIDHDNDLKCPSCGHCFCAVHGDAHLGISCDAYIPTSGDLGSEQIIGPSTKPCSHCGMGIHKEDGCDHIVCSSCKGDMCFKCGSHEFLSGQMLRKCTRCNQGYIDHHRYFWRFLLTCCLSLILYILISFLYIAISGALVVVTCGCCCCLGCGVTGENDVEKNEASATMNANTIVFRPIKGMIHVMIFIFLPICFCCLPETMKPEARTEDDSDIFHEADLDYETFYAADLNDRETSPADTV
jgi:hypothetical protein